MNYFFNKFTNSFIKKGNKQRSENLIFNSFSNIKFELKKRKKFLLKNILYNLELNTRSLIDLKDSNTKRIKFKIPNFVKLKRSKRLAIKAIENSVNKRVERNLIDRLSQESLDILKNKGLTIKNRESIYRIAFETVMMYRFRLKKRKRRRKKIKKL